MIGHVGNFGGLSVALACFLWKTGQLGVHSHI